MITKYIFLKIKRKTFEYVRLCVQDILYFEHDNGVIYVKLTNNITYIIDGTITNLETLFDKTFVKINRSTLVQIENIVIFKTNENGVSGTVTLIDGTNLLVSKNMKSNFIKKINNFTLNG